jgi:putative glutamine amidotransferase
MTMTVAETRPLIGLTASVNLRHNLPSHAVSDQYVKAVVEGAGGAPLIVAAIGEDLARADFVGRLDGLLVTGGRSDIEPHHYDGPPAPAKSFHDPKRDATTLPLIREAIGAAVPVFAVCRGIQEMNVALGGSLHQQIHHLDGKMDHRSPRDAVSDERYVLAHDISLLADGEIARLTGLTSATVNSLHGQGIDRLADGLIIEATAPDGVIEAVRVKDAPAFAIGVQWHPEWLYTEEPVSKALFGAFGAAARARAASRPGLPLPSPGAYKPHIAAQ